MPTIDLGPCECCGGGDCCFRQEYSSYQCLQRLSCGSARYTRGVYANRFNYALGDTVDLSFNGSNAEVLLEFDPQGGFFANRVDFGVGQGGVDGLVGGAQVAYPPNNICPNCVECPDPQLLIRAGIYQYDETGYPELAWTFEANGRLNFMTTEAANRTKYRLYGLQLSTYTLGGWPSGQIDNPSFGGRQINGAFSGRYNVAQWRLSSTYCYPDFDSPISGSGSFYGAPGTITYDTLPNADFNATPELVVPITSEGITKTITVTWPSGFSVDECDCNPLP